MGMQVSSVCLRIRTLKMRLRNSDYNPESDEHCPAKVAIRFQFVQRIAIARFREMRPDIRRYQQ